VREHLEAAASWDPSAARKLAGPGRPYEVAYLWDWALELHGRSGVGFDLAPLTYETVSEWSEWSGERPTWREVQALMDIDRALRVGSGSAKPAPEREPDLQTSAEAWK
jgi:hypothetical protein